MAKATGKTAVPTVLEHTFPDGSTFKGPFEQLEKVASALGTKLTGLSGKVPTGYYLSESKGPVKISEMNDYHLRRALLKRSKEYFTEVYDKGDDNKSFLAKFTAMTDDNIIVDLYNELAKRL